MKRIRLAIVATHPIQHFVSFYRALAAIPGLDLRVIYGSRKGLDSYFDVGMNRQIAWKMDLLAGYAHEFLADGEQVPPGMVERALVEFRPDAVIVYGYADTIARAATRGARSIGARTMMISDSELRSHRSLLKRVVKAVILPLLYRRTDAFLSVGDENDRYYRRYYIPASRIFRSPFAIDEAAFNAAREHRPSHRARLLDRLALTGDPFLALFVGKLVARKRPVDLVDAIALLVNGPRPVHAVFAGDGNLKDELEQRIGAARLPAHLLGFINVDELPTIYAGCDAIVHPSQSDPHPLICSEAACVGMPMILSDRVGAEGPTDIAQRDRNAFVVPVGDPVAIAAALRRMAGDPVLTAQMGEESRRIFRSLDMRRSVAGVCGALNAMGLRVDEE